MVYKPILVELIATSCYLHLPVVQLLLNHGADPNLCNGAGYAPLHMVAVHGRIPVAERSIEQGAIVNAMGSMHGNTPSDAAAFAGYFEMVELLQQHGGRREN